MPIVREPYFTLIATGLKTVEGRLAELKYLNLVPGQAITFISEETGEKVERSVVKVEKYDTFRSMLLALGIERVLGDTVGSVHEGVEVYYSFGRYKELEASMGVCAIHIT